MKAVHVKTVNSDVFVGRAATTREEEESIIETMEFFGKEFNSMTHFTVEDKKGIKYYLNPRNIVAVWVEDVN